MSFGKICLLALALITVLAEDLSAGEPKYNLVSEYFLTPDQQISPTASPTPEYFAEPLTIGVIEDLKIRNLRSTKVFGWRWLVTIAASPTVEERYGLIYDNENLLRNPRSNPVQPVAIWLRSFDEEADIREGDYLAITYDGGRLINVYPPELSGEINVIFYVDAEGSTYRDRWLQEPPVKMKPTPTASPTPVPPVPTPRPVAGGIWYLPAGGTMVEGVAFDTYILIASPGEEDAGVEIRYIGTDGEFGTVDRTVAAGTRHTENMAATVGAGRENVAAIVRSTNDVPVIVERAMYFPGGTGWEGWHGSHNTIGLDKAGTEWFLAEGATHLFDQYIHIVNPGMETAEVIVTFFNEAGQEWADTKNLGGRRVWTVKAEEKAGIQEQLSTRVESDRPVAVDRTMYWPKGVNNWADGHASIGVTEFSSDWYLPEGATHIFNQYVLVVNPSTAQTAVEFTFTDQEEGEWTHQTVIGPLSRYTVNVGNVVDSVAEVSTRISSTVPAAAERAMYWPAGPPAGWTGGHGTVGVPAPATVWELPEGATHIFDEYVLVANPGEAQTADVTFIFRDGTGIIGTREAEVGPGRRYTVRVNDVVGPVAEVSTTVTADIPVVAERAMYFPQGSPDQWKTGHVTVGVGE